MTRPDNNAADNGYPVSKAAAIMACFNPITNLRSLWVPHKNHLMPLDGIRAISNMMVIMFHALMCIYVAVTPAYFDQYLKELPSFLNWIPHGDKRVDAFFVLSGFLIGSLLMREHSKNGGIDYKRFYIRRFFRLTPVYLLLIFFLVAHLSRVYMLK